MVPRASQLESHEMMMMANTTKSNGNYRKMAPLAITDDVGSEIVNSRADECETRERINPRLGAAKGFQNIRKKRPIQQQVLCGHGRWEAKKLKSDSKQNKALMESSKSTE